MIAASVRKDSAEEPCRAHSQTAAGVSNGNIYAEMGEIVRRARMVGRTSDDQTILFWHRGLSLSDIALGDAILKKAKQLGIGSEAALRQLLEVSFPCSSGTNNLVPLLRQRVS